MSNLSKKHSFDEVFDSQKLYRLLLSSISYPAKVVNIQEFADKLWGEESAMLAIAKTLLDNEVSFFVKEDHYLLEAIISITLSSTVKAEDADYVFITDQEEIEPIIQKAKCGTLRDPHQSATLIVKNTGDDNILAKFVGPGIQYIKECYMTNTVIKALDIRDRQFYEYPRGIDMIFVRDNGDLFSIPRLIRREVC